MASPTDLTEALYRRQAALADLISRRTRSLWRTLNVADLDRSWLTISANLVALVAGAQATAAAEADGYLDAVLAAQGIDPSTAGAVNARTFAGSASDGRSLLTLLHEPVIRVKQAIGAGATASAAMGIGAASLDLITHTQVADAGRGGVSVAMAARTKVGGYVRMVSAGACSRCVVLAGRFYRWNQGFLRHPKCHCRHIPSAEDRADDLRTDPKAYFSSLPASEQDRVFTKAGAQAIRDGADISQVVNARRGMYTAGGVDYTRESTTRRGVARGQARLMPEAIYRQAGSREEAIALLKQYRFIL